MSSVAIKANVIKMVVMENNRNRSSYSKKSKPINLQLKLVRKYYLFFMVLTKLTRKF